MFAVVHSARDGVLWKCGLNTLDSAPPYDMKRPSELQCDSEGALMRSAYAFQTCPWKCTATTPTCSQFWRSPLKERTRNREHPLDFATVVLHQIRLNLADTPPSAAKIAKIMGLSEGAFARRLRELNLSFPILIGAARQELAFHYLQNSDMEFTEIAFLLGYSELSAFSRCIP